MNKSYKTIWNEVLRAWVAVSEAARSRGKRGAGAVVVAAVVVGTGSLGFGGPAQATVTLTGDLGQLQPDPAPSLGCEVATVPRTCTGEVRDPYVALGSDSIFVPPPVGRYFLIGFNNSNSNSPFSPAASGSATFNDGSVGAATGVYIGFEGNTTGTMTVTGDNSAWLRNGGPGIAVIGHYGTGTLKVEDGGSFESTGGVVGNKPDAQATAIISGVSDLFRSTWINSGTLTVGKAGATGMLYVWSGGVVYGGTSASDPGYLRVGIGSGANGTVQISGASANGTRSEAIFTGNGDGTATVVGDGAGDPASGAVHVLDGGMLQLKQQPLVIGTSGGSGSVTVSGVGAGSPSGLSTDTGISVGTGAGIGTLNVLDGGNVASAGAVIGDNPGSQGNATVSGVNGTTRSTWTNRGTLTVGNGGGIGTLNVLDGALVSNPNDVIVGGSGAIKVSGASGTTRSLLDAGALNVGLGPQSASLSVQDGGQVRSSNTLSLGGPVGSTGIMTISGINANGLRSTFTSSTPATRIIGGQGNGTLSVLDGGSFDGGINVRIGSDTDGVGVVNVSGVHANGTASKFTAGLLSIGVGPGALGTLNLSQGGIVEASNVVTFSSAVAAGGVLNIGAPQGSAPVAPGTLSAPVLFFSGPSFLNFNHTGANHEFGTRMFTNSVSAATVINQFAGVTNLTSDSSLYFGFVDVQGGTLRVNGTLGGSHARPSSQVRVRTGGTLGGAGTIGGSVAVGDGVLAPGNSPGTLTINGNLALSSSSRLNYELGQANVAGGPLNDLTVVKGNLTLDGTLNVTQSAGGQFGAGTYRLIDYAGTLTDNGLALGSMPAGTVNTIQTSVPQQVNLVNTQGLTLNWWDGDAGGRNDGLIAGGNGTWTAAPTGDRWTQADGLINGPYQDPSFAIFAGAPGTVTVDNSQGPVRVTGMQFATGGYRIEGASVELTAGTNAIRVGDGTAAGAGTSATIASALTGAGKLDKVDAGTLVLTGANSYTGGTTVSGGTLQLGDGGSSGSIAGDVTNNATLAFNRSDAQTFAGAISGSGKLSHIGSGTTTLTGSNSYSGGTSVLAGTLTGSAASFGSGAISNHAALVIDQPGSAAMANPIDGSGSLTVRAGGTLDYTGTGTLSGPTTVATGTLAVNGSLAHSAVAVNSGATLAGSGTVGATTLHSGATVAPGNAGIGTLTVNGPFTQAAGSTYQAQVQPGSSSSDRIDVAGSAAIASGATLNVVRSGNGSYAPNVRYTVLSAQGGVSGHYALTGDTSSAFVQLKDSYDANHVYLTADQFRGFGSVGTTPNQSATGQALDRLPVGHALGTAVAWLPSEAAARAAFDQLSGEIHASVKTAALEDSRFVREAALERLRSAACAPGASSSQKTDRALEAASGCAADGSEHVLWAQTFGSWGRLRGNASAQDIKRDIGGFFVGADTGIGDWRVGGLGGYSRASADTDARGRGRTDSYHLGLYAGTQWGATALRLGAAYARHKVDTRRDVAFEGFADRLAADYHGATAQVFGEVGHRIDLGSVALEPFAGLAHVQLRSGAFRERGGAAALQGDSDSISTTFATLGVRASAQLGEKTRLRGMLGWRHAFGDTAPESRHAFAGSLTPFAAGGVPLAKNVAVLEAGVDTELAPDLRLGAAYTGQFGGGLRDHGFKVNLSWKF